MTISYQRTKQNFTVFISTEAINRLPGFVVLVILTLEVPMITTALKSSPRQICPIMFIAKFLSRSHENISKFILYTLNVLLYRCKSKSYTLQNKNNKLCIYSQTF